MSDDEKSATFVLDLGDEDFRCDIPVSLAKRIDRATAKTGLSNGELWDVGRKQYGKALQPDNSGELYTGCETGRDAQETWVNEILKRTVDAILEGDAPPDSPVGRAAGNRFRVDEEVK